jgi:hypothetical protein
MSLLIIKRNDINNFYDNNLHGYRWFRDIYLDEYKH